MANTVVTVCKNVIMGNQKNGTREPAIRVKVGSKVERCHVAEVVFEGKVVGRFVYDHDSKKPWGARAWFETAEGTVVRPIEE